MIINEGKMLIFVRKRPWFIHQRLRVL